MYFCLSAVYIYYCLKFLTASHSGEATSCLLTPADVTNLPCSDALATSTCQELLTSQPWLCFDAQRLKDCTRTCYVWRLYNPETTPCDVNINKPVTSLESISDVNADTGSFEIHFRFCGYDKDVGWMIYCADTAIEGDEELQTTSGSCVPISYFGDGVADCADGSDEDTALLTHVRTYT